MTMSVGTVLADSQRIVLWKTDFTVHGESGMFDRIAYSWQRGSERLKEDDLHPCGALAVLHDDVVRELITVIATPGDSLMSGSIGSTHLSGGHEREASLRDLEGSRQLPPGRLRSAGDVAADSILTYGHQPIDV